LVAVLAVEPNIKSYDGLNLVNYKEALTEADIVIFLVAHKEFKGLEVANKLDFCGVVDRK
jgi:UDP-N-acetyl-D-mannosaminuronic acid dehydrogenase